MKKITNPPKLHHGFNVMIDWSEPGSHYRMELEWSPTHHWQLVWFYPISPQNKNSWVIVYCWTRAAKTICTHMVIDSVEEKKKPKKGEENSLKSE